MGWKTINGRQYYYRSRREGGRVVTEYMGRGEDGALFALLDAEDREHQAAEREAERAELEQEEAEERALEDWFDRVESLAHASLIATGFHRHKRGEWRRRRDVRDEQDERGDPPTKGGPARGQGPGDPGRD